MLSHPKFNDVTYYCCFFVILRLNDYDYKSLTFPQRFRSSCVNPKLLSKLRISSYFSLEQLWIDAYSNYAQKRARPSLTLILSHLNKSSIFYLSISGRNVLPVTLNVWVTAMAGSNI
jgi:hypothetical protein